MKLSIVTADGPLTRSDVIARFGNLKNSRLGKCPKCKTLYVWRAPSNITLGVTPGPCGHAPLALTTWGKRVAVLVNETP